MPPRAPIVWRAERPLFSEVILYCGDARMATIHYVDSDPSLGKGWRLYPNVFGKRPSRKLWQSPQAAALSTFGTKARTAVNKACDRVTASTSNSGE